MSTYSFTLRFAMPDPKQFAAPLLDALHEAGCDDAVVGTARRGTLALAFDRAASSPERAISTAIRNVKSAIPGATLIGVSPDLVNLAELAAIMGGTRQNLRKYAAGEARRVAKAFPPPVVEGPAPLWRLYEAAKWLDRHTPITPPDGLLAIARAAASQNLMLQRRRLAVAEGSRSIPER